MRRVGEQDPTDISGFRRQRAAIVWLLSVRALFANLSRSGEGAGCRLLSPGCGSVPRSAVDRRQRGVGIGPRIAFDAAADAVQMEVEGGELNVGLEDLADPPWIEDGRVFARQASAALAAQFAAEIAALQRMHVLLQKGEIELQDVV